MLQVNILKSRLPGSNSSGNSGNSNSPSNEAGQNSLPAQQQQDDALLEENEKVLNEYYLTAE
jgi:hypothetical protein